ncbi:hypothetical protein [Cnuella takakiae]|nr:hypothetical protein [Cnuella takakiae]OLY92310.1 hypothetical protein BUE76_10690 [Cnuella takakiae]
MTKAPQGNYTVKVPTKTYLRKYVTASLGAPIALNYSSTLGTLILSLLEMDSFSVNMNLVKQDTRLTSFDDCIEAVSSIKTMRYKGYSLTPTKIIAINRFLENAFIEDLYIHCKSSLKKREWRPGIEDGIRSFAEGCGIIIDEDISLDALKKAEWRFRKKKEERKLQTFVLPQRGTSAFAFC